MVEVLLVAGRLDAGHLRALQGLAERLAVRGITARLLCAAAGEAPVRGLDLIEAPGLGQRWRSDWTIRRLVFPTRWRPRLLYVLEPALAEIGLALAEHLGLPYLLAIDEFLPAGATLRLSRHWCRGLVAPGRDVADDLIASLGVPREWVEVVPPGIALPDLDAPPPPRPAQVPVVGIAGSLFTGEGLVPFFEAARMLVDAGIDAEFVVAGHGGDESALRRVTLQLDLAERVTFAEERTVGEAFWTVFDVYCQTSLRPSAGRAVGAAMAHAVPVVASDVPGLRRWIEHGCTGLLVPPGDAPALAETVRSLLADPARAHALGQAARAWVARACDPEHHADALAAFCCRSLISETRPPRPLFQLSSTPHL